MNFDEEIRWSKLIIELYEQYLKQVYNGNIEEATKTLQRLTNMKAINVNIYEKVQMLKLNELDREYLNMAIIKEKAHHGLGHCTGTSMLNINSTLNLLMDKNMNQGKREMFIKQAQKSMKDLDDCIQYFDRGTRVVFEMEEVMTETLREICDGVTHMSWARVQELSRKIEDALSKLNNN